MILLSAQVLQTRAFTNGQTASMVIGQKGFNSYAAGTSRSGLNYPTDVTFDSAGNMWVVDGHNCRVLEFKPPFVDGMNASIVIGQKTFTTQKCGPTRNGLGFSSFAGALPPLWASFDSVGDLWVVDGNNCRVLEYKPPFGDGMNASIVIGQQTFNANTCASTQDRLAAPATVAVFDSSGSMWVDDSGNNRVLEFTPPFSSGMNASLVVGQTNFESSSPSLSQHGLNSVLGAIAMDPSGNLWVGDVGNNRILEYKSPFNNGMNASLVVGQKDFASTTTAQIGPSAYGFVLNFDPIGNLWIYYNQRLLEIKPPFTNGMTYLQASTEIGQPNFTSRLQTLGSYGFNPPDAISFDSSGNLWVVDSDDNRVLEYAFASSATNTYSGTTGGGIPEFPYQPLAAVVLTAIMVTSYVLVGRGRSKYAA